MQVSLELCLYGCWLQGRPSVLTSGSGDQGDCSREIGADGDNLDNLDEKQSLIPCRIVNQYC